MSVELVSENNAFQIDSQSRAFNAPKVDGVFRVASDTGVTISGKPVLSGGAVQAVVALGNNGAGSLVLAAAKVGDKVAGVANMTTPGDLSSSFETTISIAGHIAQSSATNLSAVQCQFILVHQTPANS